MEKITAYKTSDGTQFTDKKAAQLHEARLEAKNIIVEEYGPTFAASNNEALRLLHCMLEEPQFFIDALADYAKLKAKYERKLTENENGKLDFANAA